MALTTVEAILAGMQYARHYKKNLTGTLVAGRSFSLFYLGGRPGAGVAPTPGIGGEVLTTLSGQLPFTNPVSGNTNLAKLYGMASQAGSIQLCDRLWQNSGIDPTLTSEQVFTASAQIPARDALGANNGIEVYAGVEVSGAMGAAAPTITVKYTNSAGVASHTGTNIVATTTTSPAGTFHEIGLQAGDVGVQKAESITFSVSWLSGTCHVILYRIICELDVLAGTPNSVDALSSGFPRLFDNSVPFLIFVPNTTTSSNIGGHVKWAQG